MASNNPQAARSLKERIKQQCKLLADFAEMGRNRDNFEPGLRSFPLEDYIIFYRAIEGGIEIARVVSGYRDLEILFQSDDPE
ncbi:type II toxin-antitoxin system RelE/ParE family toxin [Argonema galeatum]|uniref:type II toxin-antitoxin system RelE/ParE family toxin n=1 Tax=Argonema galeatum TaxID=2942762 RepID=UPI0030844A77|nr:type II toxin-antitoxin system RelE/ParE family toxin [Argonema galeatum A003/A1]